MDTPLVEVGIPLDDLVPEDETVQGDGNDKETTDCAEKGHKIVSTQLMEEEKTSLLPKNRRSQSSIRTLDEDQRSYIVGGSRPGSLVDSNINVSLEDHSSDYNDYSIRIDSALSDRNDTENDKTLTHVYKRRWYILFVLSMCVTLQNAVWASWGPIAESAKFVYGWDTTMIFVITNCGNIGVLLPVFCTGHLVSSKGIRLSMVLCSFLLAFGTGLKVIPKYDTIGTVFVGAGQFFNGLAGSITQIIPSVISETWFPSNERATATAIGVISNSLGSIVAFMLGPNIVMEPNRSIVVNYTEHDLDEKQKVQHQIWELAIIEFGVGAALFIVTLIYFPSKPPSPPSISAKEDRVTFNTGICSSIARKPLVLIAAMSCAVPWAVYGNWMGLISVNFHDIGISQSQAGWFGFYASIVGVVFGIIVGRIADKFPRQLKLIVVFFFVLALLDSIWITCMRNGYISRSTVLLAVSIGILGASFNACLPLCYEMACENGYPIHEGIVGTIISLEINLTAVIFLLMKFIPGIGVVWMNWVLIGVVLYGILCLLCMKEKYHRTEVDDASTNKLSKTK
ncbi:Solute carrier 49 member 4 [Mactra antiquata]